LLGLLAFGTYAKHPFLHFSIIVCSPFKIPLGLVVDLWGEDLIPICFLPFFFCQIRGWNGYVGGQEAGQVGLGWDDGMTDEQAHFGTTFNTHRPLPGAYVLEGCD